MILLLWVMFLGAGSVPLPEFQLHSGGKVIQREIPVFGGVDWPRSRRGVCYDKDGSGSVSMGQQFYLDCGRCTCDRYGFWCIPKCSPFFQPDLVNCVEIVDIKDPCCPRKECVKFKDPTAEPSTDPWAVRATVSYFNGIGTDGGSDGSTMPMTDELDATTSPKTFESTTDDFGGAFTTNANTPQTESEYEPTDEPTDELVTGPESTEPTRGESSTYDSFTTSDDGTSSTESTTTEEPKFTSTEGEPRTINVESSSATNSILTVASDTTDTEEPSSAGSEWLLYTGTTLPNDSSEPASRETLQFKSSPATEDAPSDASSSTSTNPDLLNTTPQWSWE